MEMGTKSFRIFRRALIDFFVNEVSQALEFFLRQGFFLFFTKNRDADIPPGIEVQVVDQVLKFLVGSHQSGVQAVAIDQLPQGAFSVVDFAGNLVNLSECAVRTVNRFGKVYRCQGVRDFREIFHHIGQLVVVVFLSWM